MFHIFPNPLKIKVMPKQTGIVQMSGTMAGITFYKAEGQDLAKQKSSLSGERVKTSSEFARTQENFTEFGRAAKAGKLLRDSISSLLGTNSDKAVSRRLTSACNEVIKSDATSVRGERNMLDGEIDLLEGFQFNINAVLGSVLLATYTATINRVAGTVDVTFSPFVPVDKLKGPAEATHFSLVMAGVEADFEGQTAISQIADSGLMPIDSTPGSAVVMSATLTANSTNPLFAIVGVKFYQDVNGIKYELKDGSAAALGIVKAQGV